MARVGEGFVAGVNDGAVVLDPFEEIILDVIGALADLEEGGVFALDDLAAKTDGANGTDTAGAGEQDAQGQEREEGKDVFLVERGLAVEGIVFVAAEGCAGVVVDVVPDEADGFF